jgi:sporulation protein YlmC with PRC-barrel domain
MYHEGKELKKYDIKATDGAIGTVQDFFFDDQQWTTRYLVIDTLKWLPGKKVLVSPMSIERVDHTEGEVNVALSKDKIKDSPDVDSDQPISKQKELEFGTYYGYPPYQSAGTGVWGRFWFPAELLVNYEKHLGNINSPDKADETNLRSIKEVTGYTIHATDGNIGHVEDFIIDDKTWKIRYMIIDTKSWWPGKKVLVSPEWILDVQWEEKTVHVDLTKETIKSGPEYVLNKEITREWEENLHEKYNKTRFWL